MLSSASQARQLSSPEKWTCLSRLVGTLIALAFLITAMPNRRATAQGLSGTPQRLEETLGQRGGEEDEEMEYEEEMEDDMEMEITVPTAPKGPTDLEDLEDLLDTMIPMAWVVPTVCLVAVVVPGLPRVTQSKPTCRAWGR